MRAVRRDSHPPQRRRKWNIHCVVSDVFNVFGLGRTRHDQMMHSYTLHSRLLYIYHIVISIVIIMIIVIVAIVIFNIIIINIMCICCFFTYHMVLLSMAILLIVCLLLLLLLLLPLILLLWLYMCIRFFFHFFFCTYVYDDISKQIFIAQPTELHSRHRASSWPATARGTLGQLRLPPMRVGFAWIQPTRNGDFQRDFMVY